MLDLAGVRDKWPVFSLSTHLCVCTSFQKKAMISSSELLVLLTVACGLVSAGPISDGSQTLHNSKLILIF